MTTSIDDAIRIVVDRGDLSREQMTEVFAGMMEGTATDVQKSALLVALRMKGETAEEIAGAALAMRERVTPLAIDPAGLVDTCGTGGDGKDTFNVSTVAAIVAAGAGAVVAKHGNRAVSSSCGSADVLAALGVDIEIRPEEIPAILREIGIAFLFAPRLHPAMSAVAAVRKQLRLRTIFNVLGPLTNPAFARRQVLGVYAPALVPVLARTLLSLGAEHAMVVHSRDGLDEISVSAATTVCEVRDGEIRQLEITPEELGLQRHAADAIGGGDTTANVRIARSVLGGERGAERDIVLANAGAAIYVAGAARTLREGVEAAAQSIDSGAALGRLEALVSRTQQIGKSS